MATNPIFADVAAWPTPPAPVGHNRPPLDEEAKATFRDELLKDRPDFLGKIDDFERQVGRVLVDDDESLGRAAEFIASLRDADKHVTAVHKTAKEPYLAAGRAVDAEKNALIGRLDTMKRTVTDRSNTYIADREAREHAEQMRREAEARRQQEEADAAEALRQEAADNNDAEALAAVPIVAAPVIAATRSEPVRSASGVVASARSVTTAEVTDYDVAYREVRDNPKVQEAISKAIQGLVRAGKRDIPGVRITTGRQMVAR